MSTASAAADAQGDNAMKMLEIRQDPRSPFDQHVVGRLSGKIYFTGSSSACIKYVQNIRKQERNEKARAVNQVLRDLTGTSAAAARRDMGLNAGGY